MSTLYVSDLDGTLLRSNETISEYATAVIASNDDDGVAHWLEQNFRESPSKQKSSV